MKHTSFTLEGVYYHQQYRKCGKVNCTVCQDGPGHGPYWYGHDKTTHKTNYIGKNLPAHLIAAAHALDRMRKEINRKYTDLMAQAVALERLSNVDTLEEEDRTIIEKLGFGECLVLKSAQIQTQDTNSHLVSEFGQNDAQDDDFLKMLVSRVREFAVLEIFGGVMDAQKSRNKLALDYAASEGKYTLQLVAHVRGRAGDVYTSKEIAAKTKFADDTAASQAAIDTLAVQLLKSLRTGLNQFAKFSLLDVEEKARAGLKRIIIE